MSALARTALRLSVVAALNADPTLGVMVKGCVYDSRIVDLDAHEPVPVIVVITEDETGEQFSKNNGGPPFDATVDLILEISMKAVVPSTDGGPVDLLTPYTDSELEATLDLIEERAIDAITVSDTKQSLLVRQAVTRRVPKMRSSRFVLDGVGDKLATRLLTLTVELKTPEPDHPLDVTPGVFGGLPEPLRTVCGTFATASAEYATCKAIADRWNRPVEKPFSGLDGTYAPADLRNGEGERDGPRGPDAAIFEQEVDICPTPPSENS